MHILLLTIIAILVFLGFILVIPLITKINAYKNKSNNIVIDLDALFGLLKYEIEVSIIDWLNNENKIFRLRNINGTKKIRSLSKVQSKFSMEELWKIQGDCKNNRKLYYPIVEYISKKIKLENFYWRSKVGVEDAAVTAVLVGIAWMIKGNIVALLKNKIQVQKMAVEIEPEFNKMLFETRINCIISVKIGYIIIACIKIGYLLLKEGGVYNGKSSNRSLNENYNGKLKRYGRC